MKKLVIVGLLSALLVGCNQVSTNTTIDNKKPSTNTYKEYSTIDNSTIIDKVKIERKGKNSRDTFKIILSDSGNNRELYAGSEEVFKSLKKGDKINVSYDEEDYIREIKFLN
ncbi:hypothetical protein INTERNEXUS_149 [Bacillus phage vB_BspM_Internexus]|nr:hypothetical protein INTERNEXUS_149 [Bacillus phage vB_BspM_Internexus]